MADPKDDVDSFPQALASRVGFLLAQAHMAARAKADQALDTVGLTMKGFATLSTVISAGPISQRRLSRRIRMDPATMVAVVDELEEAGYLVRRRNPSDRREYSLHVTAKGRALYSRAERAIIQAEHDTMGGLDAGEAKMLMDLLRRVAGA